MKDEVEIFKLPFPKPTAGGEFSGLAVSFGSRIDAIAGPTVFVHGAFKKTIRENGHRLPIDWMHVREEMIGWVIELREEQEGVFVRGFIVNQGKGAMALALMKKGEEHGHRMDLSITSVPIHVSFQEFEGETVRIVEEAKLIALSVVDTGADPKAKVIEIASAGFVDREAQLREAELQWAETEAIIAGTKKPRGKTGAENELALAEAQLDATEGRLRELRAPGPLHAERFATGSFPLSGKPKLTHKRSVARAGRRPPSVHEYARYVNRRSLAAARALGAHCHGCQCFEHREATP